MITLHTTALSANGRKVLAAGHHLGLDLDVRSVDVYRGEGQTPEYLTINPSGKIPALVDGEFVLTESNAILSYLAEAYGNFELSSRDPRRRADIARWQFWEAAHWQPALYPVLAGFVGHALRPEAIPAPEGEPDWNDAGFAPLARRLEAHLGERTFLGGEQLSIADLSVAGMMTYFRAARFPFDAHPALARWYGRIEALEAWQATATPPWE